MEIIEKPKEEIARPIPKMANKTCVGWRELEVCWIEVKTPKRRLKKMQQKGENNSSQTKEAEEKYYLPSK